MLDRTIRVCIGVLFLAAGAALPLRGDSIFITALESLSWPQVQGQITESYIKTVEEYISFGRRGTTSTTNYIANVFYEYQINEAKYSSDNISFGPPKSSSHKKINSIINRYQKGMSVKIYYHPNMPGHAVLEPGVSWLLSFPVFWFWVVWISFGILIMFSKPEQINSIPSEKEPSTPKITKYPLFDQRFMFVGNVHVNVLSI